MSKGFSPTEREKWLIAFLLAFLVIFFAVYFLFLPLAAEKKLVTGELNDANALQRQTDASVAAVAALVKKNDDLTTRADEIESKLSAFTSAENIERDITAFLLSNGVSPLAIKLTPEGVTDGGLIKYKITVNAQGARDDLLSLADYAGGIYSYKITSADINGDAGRSTGNFTIEATFAQKAVE